MDKQSERTFSCTLTLKQTDKGERIKLSIRDDESGLMASFEGANDANGLETMEHMAGAEFGSWVALMADAMDEEQ